jgi:hypothetical protein
LIDTSDFRTMPLHCGEFLEGGRSSPGVFLVKQRARLSDVIGMLVLAWAASEADECTNRILEIP